MNGMTMIVAGVAFVAFCVWLTVRIVNRREHWAIWTAVALPLLSLAYLVSMSIGPVCWISSHVGFGAGVVSAVYSPLISYGPYPSDEMLESYSKIGAPSDWCWMHSELESEGDPADPVLGFRFGVAWRPDRD